MFPPAHKDSTTETHDLKKANQSKGWDAKLLAYVADTRDTVAGLPGDRTPRET